MAAALWGGELEKEIAVERASRLRKFSRLPTAVPIQKRSVLHHSALGSVARRQAHGLCSVEQGMSAVIAISALRTGAENLPLVTPEVEGEGGE